MVNGMRCTVSWRPTTSLANHTDHAANEFGAVFGLSCTRALHDA
jgi:hypothetical protein